MLIIQCPTCESSDIIELVNNFHDFTCNFCKDEFSKEDIRTREHDFEGILKSIVDMQRGMLRAI